jgi:hypothetical protein
MAAHPNIKRVRNQIQQEKMKGQKVRQRKKKMKMILLMTVMFILYLFILNQDIIFKPTKHFIESILEQKI